MDLKWEHRMRTDEHLWETVVEDAGVEIYARISRWLEWDGCIVVTAAYGLNAEFNARGATRGVMLRRLTDEIDNLDLREFVTQMEWPGSDL